MSISSISSTDPSQASGQPSNFQTVRSDFQNLASALSSGDLTQAQQAFSQLKTDAPGLMQNGPQSQGLAAIGQALQSGDVSGAQQAFSALQQAAKGHHHHHHHHGGGTSNASSSTQATGTDSSSSATTPVVGSQVNVSA